MGWKKININNSNLVVEADKATLVKMPNKSQYAGYCFWHPNKLIREGKNSNASTLSYSDEFKFQIIKYGKGKYNKRDIIHEIEITIEEFEEAFCVMSSNVREKKEKERIIPVLGEPDASIIPDLIDD